VLADRIKCTTSTTGTGALTLSATGVRDATNGDYLAPAEVAATLGQTIPYFIISGANFARGSNGSLSSDGLTLNRDALEKRWNGTNWADGLLSLSGTSTVMLSPSCKELSASNIGQTIAARMGAYLA
jgi:hypothetical protein